MLSTTARERGSRGQPPRAAAVPPCHSTGQSSPNEKGRWFGELLGLQSNADKLVFARIDVDLAVLGHDHDTLQGVGSQHLAEIRDRELVVGSRCGLKARLPKPAVSA
jgi:hypothetical protein